MNEFEYLQHCDEETILNTWHALGEMTVSNNTKVYTKNSVVKVVCTDTSGKPLSPFHDKIIFICEDYRVDNKIRFPIDWSDLAESDMNSLYCAVQGVQLPYFGILPAKWRGGFVPDNNFIPFVDSKNQSFADFGGISIQDDELETICTVIGLPFVYFEDLEYSKAQIVKYMIKPAMQRYFTFRPIIREEAYGAIAAGAEFCIPFPPGAYGCVPYYCVPGGGAPGVQSGNPFAFYNEQMYAGVGMRGSRYSGSVVYRGKQVPGYVGLNWQSSLLDNLAANQGLLNYFRREKVTKTKIDGQMYATGFSTIGGMMNIKWLYSSNSWDDIDFDDLEVIARPMARIEILRNFAIIRSLVKTDIAGQLDPNVFSSERDKIEQQLDPIIKSIGLTGSLAVMRGGG